MRECGPDDYLMLYFSHTEYLKRKLDMEKRKCEEGSPHLIWSMRAHLNTDLLALYEETVDEFPFRVAFDDGYWWSSKALCCLAFGRLLFFDGSGSLVPATHPTIDMSVFPFLGRILLYSYITLVVFNLYIFHFL